MRWPVLAILLVAGCLGSNSPTTTVPDAGTTTATVPVTNATGNATTPPVVGERGESVLERFFLGGDHQLHVLQPGADAGPLASVPDSLHGTSFFLGTTGQAITLATWEGPPAQRAFELTHDIEITLRYSSTQAAVSTTKGFGFPPVGGWFGTKDRWAVLFSATDAPDTLEAGRVYTSKMTVKVPPGGYFHRVGDPLALHTYLVYQTADDSPLSYVVGGPDAAGFSMPHAHFNVTAPVATVLLERSGTLGANPSATTGSDPNPAILAVEVPAGTAYVVAELTAVSTAPNGGDADLYVLGGGSELGSGTGPTSHEVVIIGPTGLALANGKLTVRLQSAMASGGTFRLVVTGHGQ